ncbi:hypothetical protein Peur_006584 [Populus x canadensis]
MPASLSSPFFPLPSSASPSNPNAHFFPSPPSPRRRLIPKSNHRHHRRRLSLYFLSITSRKRCIHWLLFLFIDASRSLFLLSGQFAIFKGILVIFMMPCSLQLSQLMGNAAKLLLICSYLLPGILNELFANDGPSLKEVNGVWSIEGGYWEGCYFLYEVSVYHPSILHVEKCYADDPYARALVGCLSLPTIL